MYEVVSTRGQEKVRMPSGKLHVIQTDEDGNKFVRIENPYINNIFKSFSTRAFDAHTAILDGYGDMIEETEFNSRFVIYYLDRDFGKDLRDLYLDEIDRDVIDAYFIYAIVDTELSFISGMTKLYYDGIGFSPKDGPINPHKFNLEGEAKSTIKDLSVLLPKSSFIGIEQVMITK
jgi:hypothetical protein